MATAVTRGACGYSRSPPGTLAERPAMRHHVEFCYKKPCRRQHADNHCAGHEDKYCDRFMCFDHGSIYRGFTDFKVPIKRRCEDCQKEYIKQVRRRRIIYLRKEKAKKIAALVFIGLYVLYNCYRFSYDPEGVARNLTQFLGLLVGVVTVLAVFAGGGLVLALVYFLYLAYEEVMYSDCMGSMDPEDELPQKIDDDEVVTPLRSDTENKNT